VPLNDLIPKAHTAAAGEGELNYELNFHPRHHSYLHLYWQCGMDPPGSARQLSVKMLKDTPITYTVPLKEVVDFALHGTAKGPSDILRKKRIKEPLGLD
jgi:hypothetical protein